MAVPDKGPFVLVPISISLFSETDSFLESSDEGVVSVGKALLVPVVK